MIPLSVAVDGYLGTTLSVAASGYLGDFEIGYTRPSGGFLHEYLRQGKRRLEREHEELEAASNPAIEPVQPVVDYDAGKAQAPTEYEQANRPTYDEQREIVEQILLLEFHILDSMERKRLSQNSALVLLLLSD